MDASLEVLPVPALVSAVQYCPLTYIAKTFGVRGITKSFTDPLKGYRSPSRCIQIQVRLASINTQLKLAFNSCSGCTMEDG
eukprot:scaffold23355_cov19-Prasinocladus_malaysianus.AAC.1